MTAPKTAAVRANTPAITAAQSVAEACKDVAAAPAVSMNRSLYPARYATGFHDEVLYGVGEWGGSMARPAGVLLGAVT